MLRLLKKTFLFPACIVCCLTLYGQDAPQAISLAPGLYEVKLLSCNTTFLVTDSNVVVIDAGMSPLEGRQLLDAIRKVTDKPVSYLILTHYHFDHVGGAQAFSKSTKVITHQNLMSNQSQLGRKMLDDFIAEMEADYAGYKERKGKIAGEFSAEGQKGKSDSVNAMIDFYRAFIDSAKFAKPVKPDITFDKEYLLTTGGQQVKLVNYGGAHSGSDCIIYFPKLHAVDVGDLSFGHNIPFIDEPSHGSIVNWINILGRIAADTSVKIVLTGHDESAGTQGLFDMQQMLQDLLEEVKTAKAKGLTPEETVNTVKLEKYRDYPGQDLLPRDIRAIYDELKNAESRSSKFNNNMDQPKIH